MTRLLRPAVAALAVALIAAGCRAPVPGREAAEAELSWPDGAWFDDIGGAWQVEVEGSDVRGEGRQGAPTGLVLTGVADGGTLEYTIRSADGATLAQGQARIVNAEHAYFETRALDGSGGDLHGLLHFDHMPDTAPLLAQVAAACPPPPAPAACVGEPAPLHPPIIPPAPAADGPVDAPPVELLPDGGVIDLRPRN
jgi:hypothetical protein